MDCSKALSKHGGIPIRTVKWLYQNMEESPYRLFNGFIKTSINLKKGAIYLRPGAIPLNKRSSPSIFNLSLLVT